jgi:hypothetical protein
MNRHESLKPYNLPKPLTESFFPKTNQDILLTNEILRRTGEKNLVYALEYGSYVTGDASPTSIHDVMIIVGDVKKFHHDNLLLQKADYGNPKTAGWHTFLNKFGFNFYQTKFRGENDLVVPAKFAVISKENFIKGCNGTFSDKDDERQGAFGLYVAGRIQKAALLPLYKRKDASTAEIESGINMARIDGVWFALGLLENKFSYEDLLHAYVSLSYKADVRVEKKGKVNELIKRSGKNYAEMLNPIIINFIENGLIKRNGHVYEKIESLSQEQIKKRLGELKLINFLTNYFKNPLTGGLANSILYALAKVKRKIASDKADYPLK